ncbi:MAG TPA: SDR family NAD(P)-dependent oxidoreductase, partial [Blastocatellia bacterium]|nr:SDR family NAD(P)-dependent oxidoreductase [Blastocatellia bacterium]
VYGAAKGGLSVFLQGLRNRLQPAGVAVVDLRPGFVDTPMTASLNKNFLFTTSARAGSAIYQAIKHKKHTAYIPWWWGPIMTMIKGIPEILFKRLDI